MKVKISPSCVNSQLIIPASKSVLHRAIICASLAEGESVLENAVLSKDIEATISACRTLGATIEYQEHTLKIKGIGNIKSDTPLLVDCGESGSTLRFLIPLFSLSGTPVTFLGHGNLLLRPQSIYEELFEKQQLEFHSASDKIELCGRITHGEYKVKGNVSSQFISGLLFALPLLKGNSVIKIIPPFESRAYVDLTMQVLSEFGVAVCFTDEYTICINGNQKYRPYNCTIEGDFSQFAFFAVLAAVKGKLWLNGMNTSSKQGDKKIVDILHNCGAELKKLPDGYFIQSQSHVLTSQNVDISDCPDLGVILAVLFSFAQGKSQLLNASRLRFKESDRIYAVTHELSKLGVNITADGDTITINGRKKMTSEVTVSSHNDHRIAMCLAIFGALGEFPVIIENAQAVEKSYPDFFRDLKKIGVEIEYVN